MSKLDALTFYKAKSKDQYEQIVKLESQLAESKAEIERLNNYVIGGYEQMLAESQSEIQRINKIIRFDTDEFERGKILISKLETQLAESQKQVQELLRALEFYADRTKYQDHSLNISIPNNKVKTSSIDDDQGRKARFILSEHKLKGTK